MITVYAQDNKKKSRDVLEAFAAGCGGRMASTKAKRLEPGAAAFYGVREPWLHLWEQAKREGRDWYFLDNAYFDCCREKYFRVTKNAIQHKGIGESDGKRFAKLGIEIKPMREGSDVVICTQSAEFMRVIAKDEGWLDRMITKYSGRVIVRSKAEKRPLLADLQNAKLLVTWSSAAAVTALLNGVKVACDPQCCAAYAVDRLKWASVLADNQFTLDEMAKGTCVTAG